MNKIRPVLKKIFFALFLIFSLMPSGEILPAGLKKIPDSAKDNLTGKVKKWTAVRYQSINGRFKVLEINIKTYDPDGQMLDDEYYKSTNTLVKAFKHRYSMAERAEYIGNNLVYLKSVFEIRNIYDENGNIKMSQYGGTIVEYFYNADGNETRCLTYRNNELIEAIGKKYDASGHILEETVTNGKEVSHKENFVYDEKGLLQTKIEYNFNTSKINSDYRYDDRGNLSMEIINIFPSGSPVPNRTVTNSYRFDGNGNETEEIFTNERTVKRYDKKNRLIQKITYGTDQEQPDIAYEKVIYQYDKEGNIIKTMKYILPAGGTEFKLNEITVFTIEYY